jgi:hypothetical protein
MVGRTRCESELEKVLSTLQTEVLKEVLVLRSCFLYTTTTYM